MAFDTSFQYYRIAAPAVGNPKAPAPTTQSSAGDGPPFARRTGPLQSLRTGTTHAGAEVHHVRPGGQPPPAMGGTMIMRKLSEFVSLAALALATLASVPAQAAYPERPITMVVPWGAGGGTDATARILASLMEQRLGVPVNVVNRTGGSGVVGHSA